MNPSSAGELAASEPAQIFKAFQERGSRRSGWWLLALPVLGGLGFWGATLEKAGAVRVVTPHGIRVVNPGMTQQEVLGILGRPISAERSADGRVECYQYGQLSLQEPSTTLYLICYEGGRIRDVTARRYSMWTADPSGAFFPAGINTGP